MKQLYSGTLTVLTLTFFSLLSLHSFAQTGGTYTAIQAGSWHTPIGPGIWQAAEPPSNCNNCLIVLSTPGVILLNTTVTLTNGSKLVIGGTATHTTLQIGNSGASAWANANNILLDGTGTQSFFVVNDNTDMLDASGAGPMDGVLQTSPTGGGLTEYLKEYGNAPLLFSGTTVTNSHNALIGTTAGGPTTLSSGGDLPIILDEFEASAVNGAVDLAWTTDLEINSDHFTIQSSSNAGESWNNVGTVTASGNSASPVNYSFTDSRPAQGTSEYRLALVDRDGHTVFSPVKAVRIGLVSAVSVYPNPASDYINVTLAGDANMNARIRLVNLAGQVLMEKTVSNAGGTTVPMTVSSLPAGNYLVVVTGSDGSKQVSKILIAK